MIGLEEHVISLNDAVRLLPKRREGKRPHVSCVYRWTTSGCRGVILESVQIGGTRCTSVEALQRFFAALGVAGQPAALSPPGTNLERQRAIARAERELDDAGI